MASYSDILFGKIALKNKLITPQQLHVCLAVMARARGMSLAEALVREKVLTPQKARKVQKAQALSQFIRAEKIFARIALERRMVEDAVLKAAFVRQEELSYRARLGQLLQDQGTLTPQQHESIVEEQLLRLAEDTARIEEAGFGDEPEPDAQGRRMDEISRVGAVMSDLEGSALRNAVGPRGMFSREAINRTLSSFVAPSLDDGDEEPAAAGSVAPQRVPAAVADDDVEIEEEPYDPVGSSLSSARPAGPPRPTRNPNKPIDPSDLSGSTIASRYRVLEKVGQGGMGTVYKAEHCLMEKTVALKVLHPDLVGSKLSLERFRQEIRAASRFQHKNVVQIYDAGGGEGGLFYMAMEFAEGETLEDVLRRGPLPLPRVLRILRQVLSGVAEAHQLGIVHRDLKSGNIMIVPDRSTPDLVKVMDFGLAKIAFDSNEAPLSAERLAKTQEGMITGTPQYMSPEQATGEPVDHRSDLYSLGVILFEMLTGELPFKSNTPMGFLGKHIVEPPPRPSEVAPERRIPRPLEEVVLRLLEKAPDDRFQSALEVLKAVESALEGRAPSRPESGRAPGGSKPPTPKPTSDRAPRDGKSDRAGKADKPDKPDKAEKTDRSDRGRAAARSERAPRQGSARHARLKADPSQRLDATVDAIPPAPIPTPPRRSPVAVVVGLAILACATVVGALVLVFRGGGPDPAVAAAATVEEARKLIEDDPARALQLLDPLVAAHPEDPEIKQLQARAGQERSRQTLIEAADRLVAEYRAGTSARAAAEKAVNLYREALQVRDEPQVRARMEGLGKELLTPDSTNPADDLAARLSRELEGALQARELEQAERFLAQAEGKLPAQQLLTYRAHLDAERRVDFARRLVESGKIVEARDELERAHDQHPRSERRADIMKELQRLSSEGREKGARERVEASSQQARAAALSLDAAGLATAVAAIKEAAQELPQAEADRTRLQADALEAAAPLLPELKELRAELDRLEAKDPVPTAEAAALAEKAGAVRARVRSIPDAPLAASFEAALSREAERAERVVERAKAGTPAPVPNLDVERFASAVARVRALPVPERENREVTRERLQKVRELQEYPGYGAAPAEDKRWVESEVARLIRRQQVWEELGQGFVPVTGGEWRSPGDKRSHQLPATFYVAEGELTCAEWYEYLRANPSAPRPQGFPGPTRVPVTGISIRDATRYCEWRSKGLKRIVFRLPTEAEWERAARGPDGRDWPWGETFEAGRAKEVALDRLVVVKSFPMDQNQWGLFDLVGNAAELTSSSRNGLLVVKGGAPGSAPKDTKAGAVLLVKEGSEVASTIGMRLFAEELP